MVVSCGIVITNADHPWPLKRTKESKFQFIKLNDKEKMGLLYIRQKTFFAILFSYNFLWSMNLLSVVF